MTSERERHKYGPAILRRTLEARQAQERAERLRRLVAAMREPRPRRRSVLGRVLP